MTLTLDHPQSLQLRRLLEAGLPLVSRPYAWLAEQIGASEQAVLEQVRQWNEGGLFRRVGLVLKHRALGFRANAMLVLDVPDAQIDAIGHRLGSAPGVNLATSARGGCRNGATTCSAWSMAASASRSNGRSRACSPRRG